MPINYALYPSDWKDIRQQVLDRDQHQCKWCGLDNYVYGYRSLRGVFISDRSYAIGIHHNDWHDYHFGDVNNPKRIKIVLTIAHLGIPKFPGDSGDKHDKMDCRLNNLVALCQQCHLRFDIDEHTANRKATLAKKRLQTIIDSGQLALWENDL